MVYWIICRDHAVAGERRFGPYESEKAARDALGELRKRLMGSTHTHLSVVCDFA